MPEATTVEVPMYYGMTLDDLVLEPGARGSQTREELEFITNGMSNQQERVRVLTMALMLYYKHPGILTLGECLHSAIIWERG